MTDEGYPTRFRHPSWRALFGGLAVAVVGWGILIIIFHHSPWLLVFAAPLTIGQAVWQWRGASLPEEISDDEISPPTLSDEKRD